MRTQCELRVAYVLERGAVHGVSFRAGVSHVRNMFKPVILWVLRLSAVIGSTLTLVGSNNSKSEGEPFAAVW
jgi:hypothetical protein